MRMGMPRVLAILAAVLAAVLVAVLPGPGP